MRADSLGDSHDAEFLLYHLLVQKNDISVVCLNLHSHTDIGFAEKALGNSMFICFLSLEGGLQKRASLCTVVPTRPGAYFGLHKYL